MVADTAYESLTVTARDGSRRFVVILPSLRRNAAPCRCSPRLSRLGLMLTRRMVLRLIGASAGAAVTGPELLARAASAAGPATLPDGSNGVEHVVVLMLENRSFDHFLGWLPGADGRLDMHFLSTDGNVYPTYPLAPDFQGCGYSDPDHSWEGFLVQLNHGRMDGFLKRPTPPE